MSTNGKIDASEHIKFLVACIQQTNNGKPDFTAVAETLGITSKAAAAKRYERLLKAHNVDKNPAPPSAAAGGDENEASQPQSTGKKRGHKPAANGEGGTPTKKRATPVKRTPKKVDAEDDENETPTKVTPARRCRPKKAGAAAAKEVKEMPVEEEAEGAAEDGSRSPDLSEPPVLDSDEPGEVKAEDADA